VLFSGSLLKCHLGALIQRISRVFEHAIEALFPVLREAFWVIGEDFGGYISNQFRLNHGREKVVIALMVVIPIHDLVPLPRNRS